MSNPKRLTIDWSMLEMAFEDTPAEFCAYSVQENYLDLETGDVIFVDDDVRSALEAIEEQLAESLTDADEVTPEMVESTSEFQRLPKWQHEVARKAVAMHFGDFRRYEEIPRIESHDSYQYMEDFIETVADPVVQNRLRQAIGERKPFRNFRDVLAEDRRLEQEWRKYENGRRHETILQWLRSIGIEPTNPDPPHVDWQPVPDLRKIMFAEVRRFVRFAGDLPGVERIALVGSLATDKEFPKDVDLLVTVSRACDLAELATLARQLSGHLQAHRAGGDVFLADPAGNYLGRTCPWRECGPGIRVRCDALHCGARPYLHDDFGAVRLAKDLIANPPAVLWPDPAVNQTVPADVQELLLDPLAADEHR